MQAVRVSSSYTALLQKHIALPSSYIQKKSDTHSLLNFQLWRKLSREASNVSTSSQPSFVKSSSVSSPAAIASTCVRIPPFNATFFLSRLSIAIERIFLRNALSLSVRARAPPQKPFFFGLQAFLRDLVTLYVSLSFTVLSITQAVFFLVVVWGLH